MSAISYSSAMIFCAAVSIAAPAGAQVIKYPTFPDLAPDASEFMFSCSSCHGTDAKGAGYLARHFRDVNPPDLTQLAAKNNGVFPIETVFAVIDGRNEVATHGPRQMPVWGARYLLEETRDGQPDELSELRVRNRINVLVQYLVSIQEPISAQ